MPRARGELCERSVVPGCFRAARGKQKLWGWRGGGGIVLTHSLLQRMPSSLAGDRPFHHCDAGMERRLELAPAQLVVFHNKDDASCYILYPTVSTLLALGSGGGGEGEGGREGARSLEVSSATLCDTFMRGNARYRLIVVAFQ